MKSLKENHPEIAPSTIFALACLQENCVFINGSPQTTFVKGVRDSPFPGLLIGNDFNLDSFVREYRLDCRAALNRLRIGVPATVEYRATSGKIYNYKLSF